MEKTLTAGPRRIADKMLDSEFVASLPRSRAEAKAIGAKQYITGECKNGHYSYRVTVNGVCAMCCSEAGKEKRNNYEGRKEALKKWNASERAKTAKDRWKERNPKWAWVVSSVGGARTRSKYKDLLFDLTNEYVYSIAGDFCPVLGVPLSFGGTRTLTENSASLDRIDPEKGYVVGNVAVISFKANTIKSNANASEIRAVADWLEKQNT
jgi:hypothetical protein